MGSVNTKDKEMERRLESDHFMGMGFPLRVLKKLWNETVVHSIANVLNATELHTLKWL